MKMKKTLLGAFLGVFALAGFAVLPNFVSAQDGSEGTTDTTTTDTTTTDTTTTDTTTTDTTTTDTETTTQIESVNTDPTVGGGAYGQQAANSDWVNPDPSKQYIGDQSLTGSAILTTIKNAINWLLGILATIALVICLYGGFLMVTAAGDEKKYQK
jgi:cobalamin biosynthesis Mg chelatase CobN